MPLAAFRCRLDFLSLRRLTVGIFIGLPTVILGILSMWMEGIGGLEAATRRGGGGGGDQCSRMSRWYPFV